MQSATKSAGQPSLRMFSRDNDVRQGSAPRYVHCPRRRAVWAVAVATAAGVITSALTSSWICSSRRRFTVWRRVRPCPSLLAPARSCIVEQPVSYERIRRAARLMFHLQHELREVCKVASRARTPPETYSALWCSRTVPLSVSVASTTGDAYAARYLPVSVSWKAAALLFSGKRRWSLLHCHYDNATFVTRCLGLPLRCSSVCFLYRVYLPFLSGGENPTCPTSGCDFGWSESCFQTYLGTK